MFDHFMWHEWGWALWVAIGTLVGLRASIVAAWRIRLAQDPEAVHCDWWDHPGPPFTMLLAVFAWPLVLVAAASWPLLSAPPKEVRARTQSKLLEEENRQLDYALEEAKLHLAAAKEELAKTT
jgi:hypothetical protein